MCRLGMRRVRGMWGRLGVRRGRLGEVGGALLFNGSGARVTVPDAASLRLSSAMTLEAWVSPSAVSSAWR